MDPGRGTPLGDGEDRESGVVGVRIADRVVIFNPGGTVSATPLAFSVRGTGSMRFLVADLAEGSWQVSRDGRVVAPAMKVSAASGTLYFEVPPAITRWAGEGSGMRVSGSSRRTRLSPHVRKNAWRQLLRGSFGRHEIIMVSKGKSYEFVCRKN